MTCTICLLLPSGCCGCPTTRLTRSCQSQHIDRSAAGSATPESGPGLRQGNARPLDGSSARHSSSSSSSSSSTEADALLPLLLRGKPPQRGPRGGLAVATEQMLPSPHRDGVASAAKNALGGRLCPRRRQIVAALHLHRKRNPLQPLLGRPGSWEQRARNCEPRRPRCTSCSTM